MVSIALLGNFICDAPSRSAIMALYVFLEFLQQGDPTTGGTPDAVLDKDYKLYGHCQINIQEPDHNKTFPDSPGAAFLREIQYWQRHVRLHEIYRFRYILCTAEILCFSNFTICSDPGSPGEHITNTINI